MSGQAKQHPAAGDILPLLQKSLLGQDMTEQELQGLMDASKARLRHYEKGELVFQDGEKPHCLYILVKGAVHILKDTFSGRQIFISAIDEPGDLFGEVYEVLHRPYDMYVEAASPVELLEMTSDLFTLSGEEEPSRVAVLVQRNLMRIFARKAYFMHNKLKVLGSGSLREKLVRLFFQHLQPDGTVQLQASREFLAAYLAVTRPSLSREISAMQRDGLIAVDGRHIRVVDLDSFEAYL